MSDRPRPGAITGSIVRELRRKRALSQGELASRVGMSERQLGRIENGQIAKVKREHIAKLATVLDVPPDALDPEATAARVAEGIADPAFREAIEQLLSLPRARMDVVVDALRMIRDGKTGEDGDE